MKRIRPLTASALTGAMVTASLFAAALPANAATVARTRSAQCTINATVFTMVVSWLDYGTTVEPQGITLAIQPTQHALRMDYTIKYRPGDNGTPWYTRSGSIATEATAYTFYPASSVASHTESSLPNVQAHMGPLGQTAECFARVNLY